MPSSSLGDVAKSVGKLPLAGRIGIGFAVLVIVLSVGFYAYADLDSTRVVKEGALGGNQQFAWTGGEIGLYNPSKSTTLSCAVQPERGGQRTLRARGQSSQLMQAARITEQKPWFSGGAQVRCSGEVYVYQDGAIARRQLVGSPWYKIGSVVLAVLPIGIPALLGGTRRRRNR